MSYIRIQAYTVMQLCDKKISCIEDDINARKEKILNRALFRESKKIFFKKKSREELEYELNNDLSEGYYWLNIAKNTHTKSIYKIKSLSELAFNSGDSLVFLSVDDYKLIKSELDYDNMAL
jgi:hypothetical protein